MMGITYRLIQDPCHAIHKELEVLGPMKPPKVVAVVVLWRSSATIFWNGIQEQNEEELQAVYHQNLLRVLPNNMVIWYPPSGGVIFHSLFHVSSRQSVSP